MLRSQFKNRQSGSSGKKLASAAGGSILVRCCALIFSFLVTIGLARALGPSEYGAYAYIVALVSLISVPVQFGLPNLLVRETAKSVALDQWQQVRGLWRWGTQITLVLAVISAACLAVFGYLFRSNWSAETQTVFTIGLLLIPLIALGNLRGAALRGLGFGVSGQLPETIIRPGLLAIFAMTALFLRPPGYFGAQAAITAHAVAAAIAFVAGAFLLYRLRPESLVREKGLIYQWRPWLAATVPLGVVATMHLTMQYVDLLVLGLFRPVSDVGVYRVVSQGGLLVAFGLQAINMIFSAQFARLHALSDTAGLQRLVTASTRASLLLALPPALLFFFFGEDILRIVFGPEYVSGAVPLAILAVGQLANAGVGLAGSLLNMTGYEKTTARGLVLTATLNLILNFALIPTFGMTGAAIATASTLFVWKISLWRLAKAKLDIDSLPLTPG